MGRSARGGWVILTPCLTLTLICTALYANTLPAQFSFDDNFAVINNADVSDPSTPLGHLFRSDFWGQDLRSATSHKSYRPLTVLSWRLQRLLGRALLGEWGLRGLGQATRGLAPAAFHAANVAAHAAVTLLVYLLALRLGAARRRRGRAEQAAAQALLRQGRQAVSERVAISEKEMAKEDQDAARRRRCRSPRSPSPGTAATPASSSSSSNASTGASREERAEAFLAALLFAAHPVHTEAVAGVVGHAELLCSALSIAAFLAHMAAADGRAAAPAAHWGAVGLSLALAWAAALAKEIGITILGAMVAYDFLVAPATAAAPSRSNSRLAAATAALGAYVWLRSALAGDQLVRIYRKVENPIPFAPSSLVRKLTAGHLHSRYAGLLLLPLRLSADWSFACIPYVETLGDPRNLGTAALYLCLAYLVAAARPWELLPLPWDRERQSRAAEPGEHLHAARWRLAVAAGLVVAPFFPASNVLFYVGTSIGERLLYCPSVGFCLLAAEPLAAALRPLLRAEAPAAAAQDGGGSKEVPAPASKPAAAAAKTAAAATAAPQGGGGRAASRAAQARAVVVAALLAAYLAFFCGKTLLRNREWRDEETLFRAAERVCGRSAKVQLNLGIVERRYARWDAALRRFRRAQEIEPGYCEPAYHVGLTLVNEGRDARGAVQALEAALSCKYVAADALKALHAVFQALVASAAPDASHGVLPRWGAIQARPELQHYAEAALAYEQAAGQAAKQGAAAAMAQLLDALAALLRAADPDPSPPSPDFPLRSPATRADVEALLACVEDRRPVLVAVAAHGLLAPATKVTAYIYVAAAGERCRRAHLTLGQPGHSYHLELIHMLQAADSEDPWLQLEWGRTMAAKGDSQAALTHSQVAALLFQTALAALLQGQGPGTKVLSPRTGEALTAAEAEAAALAAYAAARRVGGGAQRTLGAQGQRAAQRLDCQLLEGVCSVHSMVARLGRGAEAGRGQAELARCLAQVRDAGCAASQGAGQRQGSLLPLHEEL